MNDALRENAIAAINSSQKKGTLAGLKPNQVTDVLKTYSDQIQRVIPKHLTVERVIQQATTLITRTPAIGECSVESLLGATMQASILGFQPVSALGQCYFVPFNNKTTNKREVQFIIGYKGVLDLARRSGDIKSIYAYPVYEKDDFDFALGMHPTLEHKPCTDEDRGELIYAYAVAHFVNGGEAFEVVTRHDVMKRKAVSQSAGSKYSPWNNWEPEMWVKTAVKKLQKWLPLSIEFQTALSSDEAVITPSDFNDSGLDLDNVDYPDSINAEFEDIKGSGTIGKDAEPGKDQQSEDNKQRTAHSSVDERHADEAREELVKTAISVWNKSQPQAIRRLNEVIRDKYSVEAVEDLTTGQAKSLTRDIVEKTVSFTADSDE